VTLAHLIPNIIVIAVLLLAIAVALLAAGAFIAGIGSGLAERWGLKPKAPDPLPIQGEAPGLSD
jgi:hypothetical protein